METATPGDTAMPIGLTMSDYNADGATPAPAAQQALHALAENGADRQALTMLAGCDVLLPDPGSAVADPGADTGEDAGDPATEEQALTLPVFEQQDGARLVPVFTSEARMAQALPQIQRYHRVPLSVLAGSWPSDDLALTIDAGAPEAVTLTAQGVKTLPSLAS
jgi:hypothetical protein